MADRYGRRAYFNLFVTFSPFVTAYAYFVVGQGFLEHRVNRVYYIDCIEEGCTVVLCRVSGRNVSLVFCLGLYAILINPGTDAEASILLFVSTPLLIPVLC
jgi:lysylphosphatidylglycerol synthetase-like protein (DUF2156 family)